MAGNGHILLRETREAVGLSREELGNRLGVSKATVQRWEYGESLPDSSDVARIGQISGDNSLWPRWMCETDEEYARRHPYTDLPNHAALASVVNARHQIADIKPLLESAERDSIDGVIDDPVHAAITSSAARKTAAALIDMAEHLEQKGG